MDASGSNEESHKPNDPDLLDLIAGSSDAGGAVQEGEQSTTSRKSAASSGYSGRARPKPPPNVSLKKSPKDLQTSRDGSPSKRSSANNSETGSRKQSSILGGDSSGQVGASSHVEEEQGPPPATMNLLFSESEKESSSTPVQKQPPPQQEIASTDLLDLGSSEPVEKEKPPPEPQAASTNLLDLGTSTPVQQDESKPESAQPKESLESGSRRSSLQAPGKEESENPGCALSSLASTPRVQGVNAATAGNDQGTQPPPPAAASAPVSERQSSKPAAASTPKPEKSRTSTPTPRTPLPPPSDALPVLEPGLIVECHSLTSTTSLNGRKGKLRRAQRETDKMAARDKEGRLLERYYVTFKNEQTGEDETYLLGRKNLNVINKGVTANQSSMVSNQSNDSSNAGAGWSSVGGWFNEMKQKVGETVGDMKEKMEQQQKEREGEAFQKHKENMLSDLAEVKEDIAGSGSNTQPPPPAAPEPSSIEKKWSDVLDKTDASPSNGVNAHVPLPRSNTNVSEYDETFQEVQNKGSAILDSLRAASPRADDLKSISPKVIDFIDQILPLYVNNTESLRKVKQEREGLMEEGMKMSKRMHVFEQKAREAIANARDFANKDGVAQEKIANLEQKLATEQKKTAAIPRLQKEFKETQLKLKEMKRDATKASQEQSQQAEGEMVSLRKSLETATRERAELLESTQQLQRSLDDAYALVEAQAKDHDTRTKGLEQQVSELHQRLQRQDEQLADGFAPLSDRATQLETENMELRRKETELSTALDLAKSKAEDAVKQNLEENEKKLQEAETRLEAERVAAIALRGQVGSLEDELRTARSQLELLTAEKDMVEEKGRKDLESLKRQHAIDIKILEEELSKAKSSLDEKTINAVAAASGPVQAPPIPAQAFASSSTPVAGSAVASNPSKEATGSTDDLPLHDALRSGPITAGNSTMRQTSETDQRRWRQEAVNIGKERDEWRSRFLQVELEEGKEAVEKSTKLQSQFEAALQAIAKLQEDLEDEKDTNNMLRTQLKAKFESL